MKDDTPLDGFNIVFTGEMAIPRDEARSRATVLGAHVTTAVSGRTTHLVTGEEPGPSKIKRAKEQGIEIVSEVDFARLLEEGERKLTKRFKLNVHAKHSGFTATESWAEKYRPKGREDFVGNKQLLEQIDGYLKGQTGYKAVLLSGPPGIGKTTAAHLVSKENGFQVVEFNASDVRNKSKVAEQLGAFINNTTVIGSHKKRVVVMDEVDGMTGDRGGIAELVKIIKEAREPIICICNDRMSVKMRTLASHCLDLRFRRPDARMILPRAKEVLKLEHKSLKDGIINEIISRSHGDLRFVMNGLQAASEQVFAPGSFRKTVSKGLFELAAEMFHRMNIEEKLEMFFEEYEMIPLFVHENYIKCHQSISKLDAAADSISFSDTVDKRIHGPEQEWSLLPYLGFYGCVYPTHQGQLSSRIDFPSFLGQNSKRLKYTRILEALIQHCNEKMPVDDMRLYAVPVLSDAFIKFLLSGDVESAVNILVDFDFTREDLLNIVSMACEGEYKKVAVKNKNAFSRACGKLRRTLPFVDQPEESADDEL